MGTKKDDEPDKKDPTEKEGLGQLNSPEIDVETGKPKRRAIETFRQAHSIAKRLYDRACEGSGRIAVAAIIADKYGGSAPFRSEALKALGQGWRNNFSTNPLAGVVDRSTPQLTDPLKKASSITFSALPADREGSAEKTRMFRERTTKLIRSWPGWNPLLDQIAQESYLYGNAAPGSIDDDWRPAFFRYDQVFLPQGALQHASQIQLVVYRQPVLLHDFMRRIDDEGAAKDAGYDLEGCRKACNEAAGLRDKDNTPLEDADTKRETGSEGYTYDAEVKVVWLFHVLVAEYEGGVDLWTCAQFGNHPVRYQKGIHKSMEDAVTLFTLQQGNGHFYGSKGIGRYLANLHIAIDRARNLGLDQLYLSGMPILQGESKDFNAQAATVRHPFIFIDRKFQVSKEQVRFDWEAFDRVDGKLSNLMVETAGAFIPQMLESDNGANTKIEAAQQADRQLAIKNGVLGRFIGNAANLIWSMQRKIYSEDVLKEALRIFEDGKAKREKGLRLMARKVWELVSSVIPDSKDEQAKEESKIADREAVQCAVSLLEDGLSIEDIAELALCPAGNDVEENPDAANQKTMEFLAAKTGSPFYDQKQSEKMQAEIAIGADRAKQVLVDDKEDQSTEAIATRQQVMEWHGMLDGEPMPVAGTDNHRIHREVLGERMAPIVEALGMVPTPEILQFGKLAAQHYADHVAIDATLSDQERKDEEGKVGQMQAVIMAAEKEVQKLAEMAQQAGAGGPNDIPPSINGRPMSANGPGGTLDGTDGDMDREKLLTESGLRMEDQKIAHRKLDIEERKLQSQEEQRATELAFGNLKDSAQKQAEAARDGMRDAMVERQQAEQEAAKP